MRRQWWEGRADISSLFWSIILFQLDACVFSDPFSQSISYTFTSNIVYKNAIVPPSCLKYFKDFSLLFR